MQQLLVLVFPFESEPAFFGLGGLSLRLRKGRLRTDNGGTDHPDRMSWDPETATGENGAWMEWNQHEPPYYPGEVGNCPFDRSKYALSHIWHEVRASQFSVF